MTAYSRRTAINIPMTMESRLNNRIDELQRKLSSYNQRQIKIEQILLQHTDLIRMCLLPENLRDARQIQEPLRTGQYIFFTENDRCKILQIIDSSNLLVQLSWKDNPSLWITGIPTGGLVDDQILPLNKNMIFEVIGTQSYPTVAGGHKTIFRLKLVHY
jgi:hypothetical protein